MGQKYNELLGKYTYLLEEYENLKKKHKELNERHDTYCKLSSYAHRHVERRSSLIKKENDELRKQNNIH